MRGDDHCRDDVEKEERGLAGLRKKRESMGKLCVEASKLEIKVR